MVMPPDPTANLVVIQPGLAVAGREEILDAVPLPLGADQLGQRGLAPGVAQGVIDPRLADGSNHHQALLRPEPPLLPGSDPGRQCVDLQRPLLPGADGEAHPPRRRLSLRPAIDPPEGDLPLPAPPPMPAARAALLEVTHGGIARHVQDVPLAAAAQRRTELGGPTEVVIAGDPAVGQASQAAVQQVQRDVPLLLELDLGGTWHFWRRAGSAAQLAGR